ncbi:hypothetical protein [Anaerotalea alkaliphila]|uniref:Uncharacterized protein n=1 Tax=Anaerotalea alkaliphila TaxID=2662126 RepID=A0A7X5HUP7_9FIRM|nr:hypothetical protein [Anaerotalea alkaliphila]NDL66997.1 hypothetical protein [Anaerotalea alkaliphila]
MIVKLQRWKRLCGLIYFRGQWQPAPDEQPCSRISSTDIRSDKKTPHHGTETEADKKTGPITGMKTCKQAEKTTEVETSRRRNRWHIG